MADRGRLAKSCPKWGWFTDICQDPGRVLGEDDKRRARLVLVHSRRSGHPQAVQAYGTSLASTPSVGGRGSQAWWLRRACCRHTLLPTRPTSSNIHPSHLGTSADYYGS